MECGRAVIVDLTVEERALARWQAEPATWFIEVLGGPQPWSRQIEIAESVRDNRETNVHSGHATGKDFILGRVCLWWLFTRPRAVVVTTAAKAKQVETVLWGEIRYAYKHSRLPLGGVLLPVSPELRVAEKWYAIGTVANDPNAFAGFRSDEILVVEDEAAGIDSTIDEAADALCAGERDRIVRIGNPICGPTHHFSKGFSRPDIPGKLKNIRISSRESPNVVAGRTVIPGLASLALIEAFERKYGKGSVVVGARIDGIAPGADADGLISLADLAYARSRDVAGVEPADEDVVRLGCDVARFGDDLTVVYACRGPRPWIVPGGIIAKADGVTVARFLAKTCADLRAWSVAIDGGGLGAGPLDAIAVLREHEEFNRDVAVYDVQFGAKSSDDTQWTNVRTELWWRLRDWIRDHASIAPDVLDEHLEEELLVTRYEMRGKAVQLESKEEIKKPDRLGRSPDRADALSLAVAGHLVPARRMFGGDGAPSVVAPEPDPRADDDDEVTVHGERPRWGPGIG